MLVDSFRASFERWSRPAYKKAAEPSQLAKTITENACAANSDETASVSCVSPSASGLTVDIQEITTHLEETLQPLSPHESLFSPAGSVCQFSPQSKKASLGHEDEAKSDLASSECSDEVSHGPSAKSQDGDKKSFASNETINGDADLGPTPPLPASTGHPQPSQSPVREKTMTTEEASLELKAKLKAIQDSVRNGDWWIKRSNERRELRCGSKNPEATKRRGKKGKYDAVNHTDTKKNYVLEPNAVSQPNYIDKFPKEMSDEQKHEMQYTVYRDSVRAYPRYKRGRNILASTTRTEVPVHETVPPIPSFEKMFKVLVLKGSRRKYLISGHRDERETCGADWDSFSGLSDEAERRKLTKKFWSWIDDTISYGWITDIYHEPFFNGKAHADGMRGFYILPDVLDDSAPVQKCELNTSHKVEKQSCSEPEKESLQVQNLLNFTDRLDTVCW